MKALHWMTACDIHRAYAARQLSPVELVRHLIDRVQRFDPAFNAFLSLDAEAALAAARVAEQEILADGPRSPLHGVPIGIKDMIDVEGQISSCHSALAPTQPARQDADVIRKLRDAGAILFGKLAMHEYAIGGPAFDLPHPPARNPWNRDYHPGGSSSGSGVAVAAGFMPLALGTDTGGSIRNPAGACGIVGLKPTYEAVSRRGVVPLSPTLDHVGPLTRSVADMAMALSVMAEAPANEDFGTGIPWEPRGLDGTVKGVKFGFVRHFHTEDIVADAEITRTLDHVVQSLSSAGAAVHEIRLPALTDFHAAQRIIFQAESWTLHAENLRERPQDYAEMSRTKLLSGAFTSAADYLKAQDLRRVLRSYVDRALQDVDVLIVANALATMPQIEDESEVLRTYPLQARAAFNLTGHPAMAMMAGMSDQGLPLSVQLVGRYGKDRELLRVAAAFETLMNFGDIHPKLESSV